MGKNQLKGKCEDCTCLEPNGRMHEQHAYKNSLIR